MAGGTGTPRKGCCPNLFGKALKIDLSGTDKFWVSMMHEIGEQDKQFRTCATHLNHAFKNRVHGMIGGKLRLFLIGIIPNTLDNLWIMMKPRCGNGQMFGYGVQKR